MRHNLVREVLDRLRLSMNNEFIEVGCDKGRVLAIAATYPIGSILGIEYEPALADIAKSNMSKQSHPRIGVCHGAAEHFDYSKIAVAYAFNPVGPDVLDLILAKIDRDRMNIPFGMRPSFRIAYVSEHAHHCAIFASHSWLERYDGFTNSAGHPISFYRSQA